MELPEEKIRRLENRLDELHEAIAQMIENEDGFNIAYYDDPERPSQVSHVDLFATLANIAAAVRKRKRKSE